MWSSQGDEGTGSAQYTDSNVAFSGKLLVSTLAGASAVKYGSTLISLPVEPNQVVAILMVTLPVVFFAGLFRLRSSS